MHMGEEKEEEREEMQFFCFDRNEPIFDCDRKENNVYEGFEGIEDDLAMER